MCDRDLAATRHLLSRFNRRGTYLAQLENQRSMVSATMGDRIVMCACQPLVSCASVRDAMILIPASHNWQRRPKLLTWAFEIDPSPRIGTYRNQSLGPPCSHAR